MACQKQLLNVRWEHHHWRPRVTAVETLNDCPETDMWARPVYRDYICCDKEEVCDECGRIRRPVSCLCDPERAERCALLREYLGENAPIESTSKRA